MKYCFCVQFVLFWSINLDVQWEDRWNHALFWYVIQGTCGFHLCFHWIWKLMNLAIFNWLSKLWIISDFWNAYFSCFSLNYFCVQHNLPLLMMDTDLKSSGFFWGLIFMISLEIWGSWVQVLPWQSSWICFMQTLVSHSSNNILLSKAAG